MITNAPFRQRTSGIGRTADGASSNRRPRTGLEEASRKVAGRTLTELISITPRARPLRGRGGHENIFIVPKIFLGGSEKLLAFNRFSGDGKRATT